METYVDSARVSCQFVTESGEVRGAPIDLPINTSLKDITLLCNTICDFVRLIKIINPTSNYHPFEANDLIPNPSVTHFLQDGKTPLSFFLNEKEIKSDLESVLTEDDRKNGETTFQVGFGLLLLFLIGILGNS